MNIFFLHSDPEICSQMHNDKHCVKMILEYAQLMSTAHRVLDGKLVGKNYMMSDDNKEQSLYKSTHINHPSAIWVRQSDKHYYWLYWLWRCLRSEYTYRYYKVHACKMRLERVLKPAPFNINQNSEWVDPPMAMPDKYKVGNAIHAYRQYYIHEKAHIAKWKDRKVPEWYVHSNQ